MQFNAFAAQQTVYEKRVLVNHEKAVSFAVEYAKTMQLPVTVALESQMDVYESKKTIYDKANQKMNYYADLERATGKKLTD